MYWHEEKTDSTRQRGERVRLFQVTSVCIIGLDNSYACLGLCKYVVIFALAVLDTYFSERIVNKMPT